jgi:hypothetical protein
MKTVRVLDYQAQYYAIASQVGGEQPGGDATVG